MWRLLCCYTGNPYKTREEKQNRTEQIQPQQQNCKAGKDSVLGETLVACAEMEMLELEEGISRAGLRINFTQYINWRYWHKTLRMDWK